MKKKSPITHYRLGQMYMIKKDYIRARQEFKKTITLDPNLNEAYKKLGDSCTVLGDFKEALNAYKTAYEHDSKNIELAMSLAICYDNCGDTENAIEVLRDITKLQEDYPMVNYNLAYGLNSLERYDEAFEYVEKEIKFHPENEMALELKEDIQESLKKGD